MPNDPRIPIIHQPDNARVPLVEMKGCGESFPESDPVTESLKREFAAWLKSHWDLLPRGLAESDAYLIWLGGYTCALRWSKDRTQKAEGRS